MQGEEEKRAIVRNFFFLSGADGVRKHGQLRCGICVTAFSNDGAVQQCRMCGRY
jgi:hypothetical protein